jgi:hypothetical protein
MLVTINVWLNPCIVFAALALTAVAPSLCPREPSKSLKAAHRFTILVDPHGYPCQVNVKARPASYRTLMYSLPRALVDRRMECLRVEAEISVELTHTFGDDAIALWIHRTPTETASAKLHDPCAVVL